MKVGVLPWKRQQQQEKLCWNKYYGLKSKEGWSGRKETCLTNVKYENVESADRGPYGQSRNSSHFMQALAVELMSS